MEDIVQIVLDARNVSALDNVLTAMEGMRIFDRSGFNFSNDTIKAATPRLTADYEEWDFSLALPDWVNPDSEELIIGRDVSEELISTLGNNLDLTSE